MPNKAKRSPLQENAWLHGGAVGACWMARKNCERVKATRTVTPKARALADRLIALTYALAHALKERNDG